MTKAMNDMRNVAIDCCIDIAEACAHSGMSLDYCIKRLRSFKERSDEQSARTTEG